MNQSFEPSAGMRTVDVHGHSMAYVEHGAGAPIVLVHGSLSDWRTFAGVMGALGARHRAIAVSLRHYYPQRWDGHGGRFSMRQHVEDVAAFLHTVLGGEPAHLVGLEQLQVVAVQSTDLAASSSSCSADSAMIRPGRCPAAISRRMMRSFSTCSAGYRRSPYWSRVGFGKP